MPEIRTAVQYVCKKPGRYDPDIKRKKPLLRRTYCNTDKSIPSPGRTLPDTGRDHPADEKRPDQIIQCAQEKAR